MQEILGIPVFDDDIYKLVVRFAVNVIFMLALVRFVYFPRKGLKNYFFSFIMVNIVVFFICFTLKKFDLGLGMALGLFAIFGVLRYRTDSIPIREMTYLFLVIGLAVINALANKKMSYTEIFFTNIAIIAVTYFLERLPLLKGELHKTITYDRMDLIKPERYVDMVHDVEDRLGLKLSRIELGRIDFLQGRVTLDIYYFMDQQEALQEGHVTIQNERKVEIGMRQKKR